MEPKFQSSFIPKGPITTSQPAASQVSRSSSTINLLPIIGNVIFILSLLAYGGLFAYEKVLNSKIVEDDKALKFAESAFDPAAIQQLVTASDQIEAAKGLLNTHIATSNMFVLLQTNLLPSVRFTSFQFSQNADGTVKVSVDGEGQSYAVVAEQAEIFKKVPYLKDQDFSSLDVTDKGTISLKFDTNIDPKLISYTQALQAVDSGQSGIAPSTQTTATSSSL